MSGLHELAFGGLIYMAGVVFFKCDGVIPFAHAIWHSFVFVGAIIHFVAVCTYLLGPRDPALCLNAMTTAAMTTATTAVVMTTTSVSDRS